MLFLMHYLTSREMNKNNSKNKIQPVTTLFCLCFQSFSLRAQLEIGKAMFSTFQKKGFWEVSFGYPMALWRSDEIVVPDGNGEWPLCLICECGWRFILNLRIHRCTVCYVVPHFCIPNGIPHMCVLVLYLIFVPGMRFLHCTFIMYFSIYLVSIWV